MTLHQVSGRLRCRTCDHRRRVPGNSMFRALMITYYVDTRGGRHRHARPTTATQGGQPFAPQALAGIVEDLEADLRPGGQGVNNPMTVQSLPYSPVVNGDHLSYPSNMIRKVNVKSACGRRLTSRPTALHRNRSVTSVDVRSLATVNRYQLRARLRDRARRLSWLSLGRSRHRHDHDADRADLMSALLIGFTTVVMSDHYRFIDRDRSQAFYAASGGI